MVQCIFFSKKFVCGKEFGLSLLGCWFELLFRLSLHLQGKLYVRTLK